MNRFNSAIEALEEYGGFPNTLQYLRDLKASHDALAYALADLCPPMPTHDAMCHIGIVTQSECMNCSRISRGRVALKSAEALK